MNDVEEKKITYFFPLPLVLIESTLETVKILRQNKIAWFCHALNYGLSVQKSWSYYLAM